MYNNSNQIVDAIPSSYFEATTDTQNSSVYSSDRTGTAYWVVDLTKTYAGTKIQRGVQILNERKQVLVQDEITNATEKSQWRIHTMASITLSAEGRQAIKQEATCSDPRLIRILQTSY